MSISAVYEENIGAMVLATSTRMTPVSNHISSKYHWLRQNVGKEFVIWKIELETRRHIY